MKKPSFFIAIEDLDRFEPIEASAAMSADRNRAPQQFPAIYGLRQRDGVGTDRCEYGDSTLTRFTAAEKCRARLSNLLFNWFATTPRIPRHR